MNSIISYLNPNHIYIYIYIHLSFFWTKNNKIPFHYHVANGMATSFLLDFDHKRLGKMWPNNFHVLHLDPTIFLTFTMDFSYLISHKMNIYPKHICQFCIFPSQKLGANTILQHQQK